MDENKLQEIMNQNLIGFRFGSIKLKPEEEKSKPAQVINKTRKKLVEEEEKTLVEKMLQNVGNGRSSCINYNPIIHGIEPETSPTPLKEKYEMVNHPKHYNNYDVEVVDMMEKIWGTEDTMKWCKMTAYKYRMRMGTKPGKDDSKEAALAKLKEDFDKEQWYLKKADELKLKLK